MIKQRLRTCILAMSGAAIPISNSQGTDLVDIIPNFYPDGFRIPAAGHEAHFTTDSVAGLTAVTTDLNNRIASSIRPFPVAPSVGGVTYQFDSEQGVYQQTTSFLGPLVSERAQTLGQGKFSFGIAFTLFEYDEFNGEDLNDLRVIALHQTDIIPPNDQFNSFEHDRINVAFDVDLQIQSLAFAGTYGVTDRLDLGLILPIVKADLDVRTFAELEVSPLNPFPEIHGGFSDMRSNGDSATGIGDVILGAKYAWLDETSYDLSAAVRVKLETGDEDDFLGTGSTTVQPFLIGSYNLGENAVLNANAGVDFDLDDSDRTAFVYTLGVYGGSGQITGAVDLMGRHEVSGDNDYLDAAVGMKWAPTENFIFSANVIAPLNDDGLRSDLIGTIGFEYRN